MSGFVGWGGVISTIGSRLNMGFFSRPRRDLVRRGWRDGIGRDESESPSKWYQHAECLNPFFIQRIESSTGLLKQNITNNLTCDPLQNRF